MIISLSSQLIHWPQGIVDDLCGRGYRVIRFDNRDCGRSEKMVEIEISPWMPPCTCGNRFWRIAKTFSGDLVGAPSRLRVP